MIDDDSQYNEGGEFGQPSPSMYAGNVDGQSTSQYSRDTSMASDVDNKVYVRLYFSLSN